MAFIAILLTRVLTNLATQIIFQTFIFFNQQCQSSNFAIFTEMTKNSKQATKGSFFWTKEPIKCQKLISVPNNFLWSQDIFKRAKKCQKILKVPNHIFQCQIDLKRARFVNSGSEKSQISTLFKTSTEIIQLRRDVALREKRCSPVWYSGATCVRPNVPT